MTTSEWLSDKRNLYIGRATRNVVGSMWANPYKMHNRYDPVERDFVLKNYEAYILRDKLLMGYIRSGYFDDVKQFGCYCSPNRCHGDILNRIIEMHRGPATT